MIYLDAYSSANTWKPQIHFSCGYVLNGSTGELDMNVSVDVSELNHIIPTLPRIGLQLLLGTYYISFIFNYFTFYSIKII